MSRVRVTANAAATATCRGSAFAARSARSGGGRRRRFHRAEREDPELVDRVGERWSEDHLAQERRGEDRRPRRPRRGGWSRGRRAQLFAPPPPASRGRDRAAERASARRERRTTSRPGDGHAVVAELGRTRDRSHEPLVAPVIADGHQAARVRLQPEADRPAGETAVDRPESGPAGEYATISKRPTAWPATHAANAVSP